MRVNHKLFCVVLMAALLCLPAHATYKEILENPAEVEKQIQGMLDQFAETGEHTILREASAMLFPGYRAGDEHVDWMPVRNRVLVLRLKVLEACYEAKDPNFVMRAPWPRDKLRPMMLYGHLKTPEAIKKYDEEMAKYKEYRDNRHREVRLKKLYDLVVGDMGRYLRGVAETPGLNLDEDIATIEEVVKNEQLREEILSSVSGVKDRNKKEVPAPGAADGGNLDSSGAAVNIDIEASPAQPVAPPRNPVAQNPEPKTNKDPSINNNLPAETPQSATAEKTINPWKFLLLILGTGVLAVAVIFKFRKK